LARNSRASAMYLPRFELSHAASATSAESGTNRLGELETHGCSEKPIRLTGRAANRGLREYDVRTPPPLPARPQKTRCIARGSAQTCLQLGRQLVVRRPESKPHRFGRELFVLDVLCKRVVQDGHLRPVGVARVGLIRHPGIAQTTRPRNQLNSASCSTDQPMGEERR